MSDLFKFPLRVVDVANDDLVIEDADGNVVVRLNWITDIQHMDRQRERGKYIVSALTNCFSSNGGEEVVGAVNSDNFCEGNGVKKIDGRKTEEYRNAARLRFKEYWRKKREEEAKEKT